jgi:hypothetical protein
MRLSRTLFEDYTWEGKQNYCGGSVVQTACRKP